MTEYSSNQPFGKEWTEKEREKYAQTANAHRDMLTSRFPTRECRPIVMRACGPPVAVVDAVH